MQKLRHNNTVISVLVKECPVWYNRLSGLSTKHPTYEYSNAVADFETKSKHRWKAEHCFTDFRFKQQPSGDPDFPPRTSSRTFPPKKFVVGLFTPGLFPLTSP